MTDPAPFPTSDAKGQLFLKAFVRAERRIYAYIVTVMGSREGADDLMQEASVVMWDKFDCDAPPEDFAAWGCRIAYYKVLEYRKRMSRQRVQFSQPMFERLAESAIEQASNLLLDARSDALATCVDKLPEKDRTLIAKRYADGESTSSAAAAVGRSVDAVYKALARIRTVLFACVNDHLAEGS